MKHVPIAMGGLIPELDAGGLREIGVSRCFHPGAADNQPDKIAQAMDALVAQGREAATAQAAG